jgi:uncharacterized membrane protein YphA (DoxX/SURF4 family)
LKPARVIGFFQRHARTISFLIGAVWVFHGLFSKILGGIPRHRQIVARILGEEIAPLATLGIGIAEVALGLWVLSGLFRRACAAVQTLAILAMNAIEITFARDLLLSAPLMVALNLVLLSAAWLIALRPPNRATT